MEQRTVLKKLSTPNEVVAASLVTDYALKTAVEPPEGADNSGSFSPEQIDTRANATTAVLHEILEQATVARDFRHWGINE